MSSASLQMEIQLIQMTVQTPVEAEGPPFPDVVSLRAEMSLWQLLRIITEAESPSHQSRQSYPELRPISEQMTSGYKIVTAKSNQERHCIWEVQGIKFRL